MHLTDGDASEDVIPNRVAEFMRTLGESFTRVSTGQEASWPSNRNDAVNVLGRNLDHIFTSGIDATDGQVLVDFTEFSDHRPVMMTMSLRSRPSPNSTKYSRLRLEQLRVPEVKQRYIEAITTGIEAVRAEIHEVGVANVTSPMCDRLEAANRVEKIFRKFILGKATLVLGRRRVPVLPTPMKPKEPSNEYLLAKSNLRLTSLRLHRLIEEDGTLLRLPGFVKKCRSTDKP